MFFNLANVCITYEDHQDFNTNSDLRNSARVYVTTCG